jgi:hypothetical protein
MNKELQDKLITDFPELFAHRPSRNPISYGIECGDGWYNIIKCLCVGLTWTRRQLLERLELAKKHNWDSLDKVQEEFNSFGGIFPKFLQIKEKFGILTIYIEHGSETDHALVDMAGSLSATTCENCGNVGTTGSEGWIVTLCPPCRQKTLDGRDIK